jgi:hypothetical protein
MYQSGELQEALGLETADEATEPESADVEAPPLQIENRI